MLERIVTNLAAVPARRATLHGRPHLVTNAVLIVPGVLNGSRGALYYPSDEVAHQPSIWDHVPLVVEHPTVNGQPVSARDPDILELYGVGLNLRTAYKDQLQAEFWFDVHNTSRVEPLILDALEKGLPLEISTGLHADTEKAPDGAVFNGKPYTHVARNYRPDHIAILPFSVGACSLQDGCGCNVTINTADFAGILTNPTWAVDEAIWEKAKKAVDRSKYDSENAYWAVVAKVYKQMGGRVKRRADNADGNSLPLDTTNAAQMSHADLRMKLQRALWDKFGGGPDSLMYGVNPISCYITDVFDKYVVYRHADKTWKIGYSTDLRAGTVALSADKPVEVEPVTTYKPVTNEDLYALADADAALLVDNAMFKMVDGVAHPASHFAYVPDPESPSSWKLLIHDAQHVGMAVAALGAGFRGQKVQIPEKDRAAVVRRVRAAWRKFHKDEEMPAALHNQEIEFIPDGDLVMPKLTDAERLQIVTNLTTNCGCTESPWAKLNADQLKALSDDTLSAYEQSRKILAANVKPSDKFVDKFGNTNQWDPAKQEWVTIPPSGGGGAPVTTNQVVTNGAPVVIPPTDQKPKSAAEAIEKWGTPEEKAAWAHMLNEQNRRKGELIGRLVANFQDDAARQNAAAIYNNMDIPALQLLVDGLPQQTINDRGLGGFPGLIFPGPGAPTTQPAQVVNQEANVPPTPTFKLGKTG